MIIELKENNINSDLNSKYTFKQLYDLFKKTDEPFFFKYHKEGNVEDCSLIQILDMSYEEVSERIFIEYIIGLILNYSIDNNGEVGNFNTIVKFIFTDPE